MSEEYNFDCPQFLDFNVPSDDTDSSDFFLENGACETEPVLGDRLHNETQVKPESHAAENVSTAKRSCPRAKSNKFSQVQINVTDSEKRRRISKSLNDINHIVTLEHNVNLVTNSRIKRVKKKSVSACELVGKKITYPVTPNCLKRAKTKVIKTSEERELEKISELRKHLADRLKYNKSVMQKAYKKQYPVLKPTAPSLKPPPNSRNTKQLNLDNFVSDVKNLNINEPSQSCSNKPDPVTKKTDVKLLQTPRNVIPTATNTEVELTNLSKNVCSASNTTFDKNSYLFKTPDPKFDAHTGLKFLENKKKSTVPEPFHFSLRPRNGTTIPSADAIARSVARKIKHRLSKSWTYDKENNTSTKKLKPLVIPGTYRIRIRSKSLLAHGDKESTAALEAHQNTEATEKENDTLFGNNNAATSTRPNSEFTFRNPLKPYDVSKSGLESEDEPEVD